jgi:hypothetical protein
MSAQPYFSFFIGCFVLTFIFSGCNEETKQSMKAKNLRTLKKVLPNKESFSGEIPVAEKSAYPELASDVL